MPDEMLSFIESGSIHTLVEPVAYDTSNIPEIENSEIKKILEDTLDGVKYAYASVAANLEHTVRPNTLEEAFKENFDLMDAGKRESIREKAVQLTGFSEPARKEIFGRYGAMDSKSFLAHGFEHADEGLEPLELDMKLLGIRTPMVSMPTSTFIETPEGLLLPKENLPTSFEEFETNMHLVRHGPRDLRA